MEEETLPDQYGIEEIYTMSETETIGLIEDKGRRLGIGTCRSLQSTKELVAESPIGFESIIQTSKTTMGSV